MGKKMTRLHDRPFDDGTGWCTDCHGQTYSFEAYADLAQSFHGYAAPGIFIGGQMVTMAMERLPAGILFDAISETASCLPDAVQILTPCTIGNGWLKIVPLGRFALTLYDKETGEGIRVFLDSEKLEAWPEIKSWFFKLKPKRDQDSDFLRKSICLAGSSIYSVEPVRVVPRELVKRSVGPTVLCPLCNEAYPEKHGLMCRGCKGQAPYVDKGPAAGEVKFNLLES